MEHIAYANERAAHLQDRVGELEQHICDLEAQVRNLDGCRLENLELYAAAITRAELAEAKCAVYRHHLRLDLEQATRKNRASNEHELLCRDLDFISERIGPILADPDPAAQSLLRDREIAEKAREVLKPSEGSMPEIFQVTDFWKLVGASMPAEELG